MPNLGIYVHIPFCKKKCEYCDFISFSGIDEKIKDYKKDILEDIKHSADKAENYEVDTIYFGGGTPSYVDSSFILDALDTIKNNYNVLEDAEITLEVNPGTASKEKLLAYKEIGINRLSIGLQSTHNRLLEIVGRIHNYEEFLDTYKTAREVRFPKYQC